MSSVEFDKSSVTKQAGSSAIGMGSGASQAGWRSSARSKKRPVVNYLTSPENAALPSAQVKHNVTQVALSLVALNVVTLSVLREGCYGPLRVIDRCCDSFEQLLGAEEIELADWLNEEGGVHFQDHLIAYIEAMSHDEQMSILRNPRTSQYYELLLDTQLKIYNALQAYCTHIVKNPKPSIPDGFSHCASMQEYAAEVADCKRTTRIFLQKNLKRAQRFLATVKQAAQHRSLPDDVLQILITKIRCLQEHFEEANLAVNASMSGLLDEEKDNFLQYGKLDGPYVPEKPVAVIAKAYENHERNSIYTLNFFVPTTLLLTCIPVALAWRQSPESLGLSQDANFYQLIAGALLQFLNLVTLLYPTIVRSRISGRPWVFTWVLGATSGVCMVLSIPLYIKAPVAWSMAVAFGGAAAQALITLQIVHAV